METIKEGKSYLRQNFKNGISCPCCGQFVKQYKRKLNSVMARGLIKLVNLERGFHHVGKILINTTGSGDFSKLKYWGLIEEKENFDKTKKASGFWKITEKGVRFAKGEIYLPKYVNIYNTNFLGFSKDKTDIVESLGNKFNYNELIKKF